MTGRAPFSHLDARRRPKYRFGTQEAAVAHARGVARAEQWVMVVYPCATCDGWHAARGDPFTQDDPVMTVLP